MMNNRWKSAGRHIAIAGLLVFVWASSARSSELQLKDGSRIRGEIIEVSPGESYTLLRPDGSQYVIPADQVKTIDFDPQAPARRETDLPPQDRVAERQPRSRRERSSRPAGASRGFRSGLSLGVGVGAMVAQEKDAYRGKGTDVYPEFRLLADLGPVDLGLSAGFVYRKYETSGWSYHDYEQSFVPVQFHLHLVPVRFARPRSAVQPYFGAGVGAYVAAGDNKDSYFMVSPTAGLMFQLGDWVVLGLDFSYHFIDGEVKTYYEDYKLDYFTAQLQFRFRIPFSGRR